MNYENPHTPVIRVTYALIISSLHGIFFLGYLYLSFLIFSERLPMVEVFDGVREFLNLAKIELVAWFVLTIFYLSIFMVLGTLSAFSSIENNLSILSAGIDNEVIKPRKNRRFVFIEIYFDNFFADFASLKFNDDYGIHRNHSIYSPVVVCEYHREEREKTISNFFGLRKEEPPFYMFRKNAGVNLIQPTDISAIDKNLKNLGKGSISSSKEFQHVSIEVLVDAHFVELLNKEFTEESTQLSDTMKRKFCHMRLTGELLFNEYSGSYNEVFIKDIHLQSWVQSPEDLADLICSRKETPLEIKPSIRAAFVNPEHSV